jgi:DNA-binding transcriptional ArsR family regulator
LLREAGLVTTQRRGTWMYYRLADGALDRVESALRATLSEKAIA